MRVLVVGGTGTVGSEVARQLVAKGVDVHVLTRDPAKAKNLPREAKPVKGDTLDPATIRSAFAGMDGLFLLNPVSATEAHEGLMAVNGARLAGIRRVAYLSVHKVDEAVYLPHFGGKYAVEAALKAAGVAGASLRANNYYQNDYRFQEALVGGGVYPQPIGGVGVSRVDVRDIGEAAAAALTGTFSGFELWNVVGPTAWTGKTTAEAWSRALGRPVAYIGDDLDSWEREAAKMLPPWMAFDFRLMYAHFQKHGLAATADDVARMTKILGHPPRRFEDFVAETAKSWKG